jgi:hypothetical protein
MPAKPDFDPSRATIGDLVQEVLRLRADIAIMAANVVQQAIEREWCGEYEQWARMTNKQMSRPHCIDRTDLESDDWAEPTQAAPLPTFDANPVYRNPATGVRYDPTLDESGRFSAEPAHDYLGNPAGPIGTWCAACGTHH